MGAVHHACGTLRMPWKGDRNSPFNFRSVVDENLKVHGTTGLYVCDMSVLLLSLPRTLCEPQPVWRYGSHNIGVRRYCEGR
ncbi:GMC oxidoreductase [Stutzerimonas stutzeri]|uniref:GMC oxidoreductase n=1 Tax=Stutzerimonas stutzeri TaxID=316 RepID=UPI003C6F8C7C